MLALALGTTAVQAQRPVSEASVESLVRALSDNSSAAHASGAAATRSIFQRTLPPDAHTNLCGAAKPAAGSGGGAGARSAEPLTRTLEVVPYAGDTTPGVNLSVQFEYGSDRLGARDRALLDNVATALQAPQLAKSGFAIAGHTDVSGDPRINLELSCARALSVRRYLVGKGVAEARLTAYGFGSTRLLPGEDIAGAVHRRVEVRRAPQ